MSSRDRHGDAGTRGSGAFHAGLTPDGVLDAAVTLTHESHLWGWSIRDLARALDVTPSVIYHHVGGRDLVARGVVERVVVDLTPPSAHLPWQDWFRTFLLSAYPKVIEYPGVAKWLLMHGPTFPSLLPIIDTGIGILRRDGFGDDAALAYVALLNNAMLTVSVSDERLQHADDGPRDHAAMMQEFSRSGADSPGAAAIVDAFVSPFSAGGKETAEQRERYYRFIVDITIAGLEQRLARGAGDDAK